MLLGHHVKEVYPHLRRRPARRPRMSGLGRSEDYSKNSSSKQRVCLTSSPRRVMYPVNYLSLSIADKAEISRRPIQVAQTSQPAGDTSSGLSIERIGYVDVCVCVCVCVCVRV